MVFLIVALLAALAALPAPSLRPAEAAMAPGECTDVPILEREEVEALAPGTELVAMTVEQGHVPTPIDFLVEHVQRGALQGGAPLVVARATSGSPVAGGKGIWFGMSGSPVYTVDALGNPESLVGAVAFGLAWDGESTIAGLQPAYQMEKVRSYPATTASPSSVTLSSSGAKKVAAATGLSMADSQRLEPLTVPLSLSGLSSARLPLIRRAAERAGLRVTPSTAGSSATSIAVADAELAAGDTFVAALSYGYLTAAATGTTTYTCGDYAMAFGHPFFHAGRTTMGANAGTDAYVVRDRLFGSYKLARVGGLAGRLDQDRAAGVRAALGQSVPLMPVTSRIQAPDIGTGGPARTNVVDSPETPFLAWMHTLNHLDDTADHWSDGTSTMRWTIKGVTPRGTPFQVQRGNRYTSRQDITFESTFDLFEDLITLQYNPFTKVRFTGISVTGSVLEDVHEYKVRRVRVWRRGAWRAFDVLRVSPGEVLQLRTRLATDGAPRFVEHQITVPRRSRGFGRLTVSGRSQDFDGGEAEEMIVDCGFDECDEGSSGPKTFTQMVQQMNSAPRNDVLTTNLRLADMDEETGREFFVQRTRRQRMDQVVSGSVRIPVRVRR